MVKQTFVYICHYCRKEHKQEATISFDGPVLMPCLPLGWRRIEYSLVCDEHTIEINIKEKASE